MADNPLSTHLKIAAETHPAGYPAAAILSAETLGKISWYVTETFRIQQTWDAYDDAATGDDRPTLNQIDEQVGHLEEEARLILDRLLAELNIYPRKAR